MSGQHTPAPWVVGNIDNENGEIEVLGCGRPYICVVLPGAIDGITEANAILIAAAPDGLSAGSELLEVVQAAIANGDWKVDGRCDPDMAIRRMQAFIAKATGAES